MSARHPAREILAHAIQDRVAAGGRSPLRLAGEPFVSVCVRRSVKDV